MLRVPSLAMLPAVVLTVLLMLLPEGLAALPGGAAPLPGPLPGPLPDLLPDTARAPVALPETPEATEVPAGDPQELLTAVADLDRTLETTREQLELLAAQRQYLLLLEQRLDAFGVSPTPAAHLDEALRKLAALERLVIAPARIEALDDTARRFVASLRAERERLAEQPRAAEAALLRTDLPGWPEARRAFERTLALRFDRLDLEFEALEAEARALRGLLASRPSGGRASEAEAAALTAFGDALQGAASRVSTLRGALLAIVQAEGDAAAGASANAQQRLDHAQAERQALLTQWSDRPPAPAPTPAPAPPPEAVDASPPATVWAGLLLVLAVALLALLLPRLYPEATQRAFVASGAVGELAIVLLLFGGVLLLGLNALLPPEALVGLLAAVVAYLFVRLALQRGRRTDVEGTAGHATTPGGVAERRGAETTLLQGWTTEPSDANGRRERAP